MRVLVLNVGSSSLKGSIVDTVDLTAVAKDEVSLGTDATLRKGMETTVRSLLSKLGVAPTLTLPRKRGREISVEAVGHRVVHGGTKFRSAVRVDDRVLKGIEALAEFAPLHNPVAVATIRAARAALPKVPQVAAFDTAFHATLSEEHIASTASGGSASMGYRSSGPRGVQPSCWADRRLSWPWSWPTSAAAAR